MPLFDTYDIVFAGGGTAACIIAGRLVQADSSLKILVIEAGPHSFNLHNHVQPARYLNSLVQGHTVTVHNSVHNEALGGRSVSVPSGCCVGGGSAVNFMIYTRAAASDYDDWEKLERLKPTKFTLTARQRTVSRDPLMSLMEDTTPTLAKSS
ncbi:hypothetical protein HHX47_DHR2000840 [Lentinula edodes]|nr:hypothetical protein HHX47_DHR2000840 [Lentinula edodes]